MMKNLVPQSSCDWGAFGLGEQGQESASMHPTSVLPLALGFGPPLSCLLPGYSVPS